MGFSHACEAQLCAMIVGTMHSQMTPADRTSTVSDIHGDQIQVDGQWYHAELIFGKSASQYIVGQVVDELARRSLPAAGRGANSAVEPDEMVSCTLYRGCSSNEMTEHKVAVFVEVMLGAGGWRDFPMIAGYVETVVASDVERCEALVAEGRSRVWLDELGWSRLVTPADIGTRYVHIDNGHHRMAAAAIASTQIEPINVPVADLRREEDSPRFMVMRP